jgi:aminopeptidase 2
VLNAAQLELENASICSDTLGQAGVHPPHSIDTVSERATFRLPSALPAGSKAQLQIGFNGKLTGSMMGYYRSSWEYEGKTKYYALTQFEVR